jgi:hypothetical protein
MTYLVFPIYYYQWPKIKTVYGWLAGWLALSSSSSCFFWRGYYIFWLYTKALV